MQALETMMEAHDIDFDCKIMCFGHVIDLCSGRVMRIANNTVDDDGDDQSDDEAAVSAPITRGRDVV